MAGYTGVISVFFSLVVGLVAPAHAQGALRATSAELQESLLRTELTALLGQGDASSSERLDLLREQIRPMYVALPKNEDGSLDQGVVRYALHRFFVQRHGWHVKGLEAAGAEKWGDAPATAMFEGRVPDFVLQLVRQRFSGVRVGLQHLAVLAATLEDLVHSEAIQKLASAFAAQDVSMDETLQEDVEERIVSTYMLFHMKPNPNYTKMTTARLNHVLSKAGRFLPGWADTLLWVQDVKQSIEYEGRSGHNPFSGPATWHDFDALTRLVEEVGERYGQYQNIECRGLKNALLELEEGETGRVRLSKFYAPALDGSAQHFGESPEYLRHLGALDETDPQRPSVIVTNYLYAKSNCLAASGFYSVCCINQCEALLGKLERSVGGPATSPQFLAKLVADMPSETIVAPRNLSSAMLARLDEIAERHGGDIPIHGRLFAQWMHHAFPNECPYPHVAGAVDAPMTAAEWRLKSGTQSARASKEDMQTVVEAESQLVESALAVEEVALPWTEEEELVATTAPARASPLRWLLGAGLRLTALLLAMVSAALGLLRMLSSPAASLPLYAGKGKPSKAWAMLLPGSQKSHYV